MTTIVLLASLVPLLLVLGGIATYLSGYQHGYNNARRAYRHGMRVVNTDRIDIR